MNKLLKPQWLFIVNTLPLLVLFFLLYGQYSVIKTLLSEENIRLWKIYGLSIGGLGLLNFVYALYLTVKKQFVSVFYGAIALVAYVVYIYFYAVNVNDIVPLNIPSWMLSESVFLYVGTFLMPSIAYALAVLVTHFTPDAQNRQPWISFLIAIGIPVVGYLFVLLVLPLWQNVDSDFFIHAFMVLFIVATLIFFFFLVRGFFIMVNKSTSYWKKHQLLWKIPIALVLPILGLMVNNGILFPDRSFSHNVGVFGNFNHYWFYILALINGILICLPNLDNKLYRLLLFIGRSLTFAYTLYFFLVFLPFLPLSVVAIIAIGTGFLMLAPIMLFILHTHELLNDFRFLSHTFPKQNLVLVAVLGFLVIPGLITANYLNNKKVLNETLEYIYNPDDLKSYKINTKALKQTLNIVRSHKDRSWNFIFDESKMPYLSAYFNWLVLDNLTLSDSKINKIERIFFGENNVSLPFDNISNESVKITNITTSSVYDTSQKVWKSQVDLEISNEKDAWFSEYYTVFELPEACWISDYYLFVEDKKEKGILSEKKSAMWLFASIRNERKDPGILYYLTGNRVSFRVFPFSANEVRKTGIEFLHKEPIELSIDNHYISLGNPEETVYENIETEHAIFISGREKQKLQPIQRQPYFHFLIDVSKDKNAYVEDYITRINKALSDNPKLAKNAKLSFVNMYSKTFSIDESWEQYLRSYPFEGGFYLDRGIKKSLSKTYRDKNYPVFVTVTDTLENAIINNNFADFKCAFPESDLFFNLSPDAVLHAHSLVKNPLIQLPDSFPYSFKQSVLVYKLSDDVSAYVPNNNEPSIILKHDVFDLKQTSIKEKHWLSGLDMQAKWMSQTLHPQSSDKDWVNLVKCSFLSGIMTPVTSYLVVENEAQKAVLQKKQKQVLSGNKALDVDEETSNMSEPSLWILLVLFTLMVCYKKGIFRKIYTCK